MNKKYLSVLCILCTISFLWIAGCGGGGGVGGGVPTTPTTGTGGTGGTGGAGGGTPGTGTPTPTPGGGTATPTSGDANIVISLPSPSTAGGATIPIAGGETTFVSFDNPEPGDNFSGPTPDLTAEPFQVFISPESGDFIEDAQTLLFHTNKAARIFYAINGGPTQQTPLLDPVIFTERTQQNGFAVQAPLRSGGTTTLVISFFGIDTSLNRTETREVTYQYSIVEQLLSDALETEPVTDIFSSTNPPLQATLDFEVTVTSLDGTQTQTTVNVPVLLNTVRPVSGFTPLSFGN